MRNFFRILFFTFLLTGLAAPMAIGSVSASVYSYPVLSADSTGQTDLQDGTSLLRLSNPELVSGSFEFNLERPYLTFKDTTPFKPDTSYHHLWKRATILSACIPGAGQIYNEFGYRKVQNKRHRAWWKVPIIYGALGAAGYYFYDNLATARALKTEWIFRHENPGQLLYEEYYDWDIDELLDGKLVPKLDANGNQLVNADGDLLYDQMPGFDLAAKRRDMLGFGFIAFWGLQVVEALVDGHFVTFDVSEDLSFNWSPTMLNYYTPGVSLRLTVQ